MDLIKLDQLTPGTSTTPAIAIAVPLVQDAITADATTGYTADDSTAPTADEV